MLLCLQIKAQLHVSSSDYDSLQQRCSECRATLTLLEQLLRVSDGFRAIQELIASKSYQEATRIHASVRDVLTDIHNTHGNDLLAFPCLVRKRTMLENELETCVMSRWKEMITWSSSPTILTIVSGPDAHRELEQLSQSLHNLGSLSAVIAKFAGQVVTNFVNKLLIESCDLDIKQDASSVSLKVIASATPRTDNVLMHTMSKLHVFTVLMESLYSNLLNINVADEISSTQKAAKDDVSLTRGMMDAVSAAKVEKDGMASSQDAKSCRSLMSMFGEECSAVCLEVLINHCLSAAIPSCRSELAQFAQVPVAVDDLQRKLVTFGFISEDNRAIVDYVKNVDVLFANKRCVELLDEARGLIMSDIHNIVQVIQLRRVLFLDVQLCITSKFDWAGKLSVLVFVTRATLC